MGMRVLATPEAKETITHMRTVINGPFYEQIVSLNTDCVRLSEPEVWDGPLAVQFRSLWLEVHAALDTAKQRLDELNQNIDTITSNIMAAGGS
jgi:hypothetical protein